MEYSGYNIVLDGTYGHKLIKSIGPGTIPVALSGSFIKMLDAQIAIDRYVRAKEVEKEQKKAKQEAKPTPAKLKKPKKE